MHERERPQPIAFLRLLSYLNVCSGNRITFQGSSRGFTYPPEHRGCRRLRRSRLSGCADVFATGRREREIPILVFRPRSSSSPFGVIPPPPRRSTGAFIQFVFVQLPSPEKCCPPVPPFPRSPRQRRTRRATTNVRSDAESTSVAE